MKIQLCETLKDHYYQVGNKVYPSVSTILNYYPKSPQLISWMQEKGQMEADRIKTEAGAAGTRIHAAIAMLIDGHELAKEQFTLAEWLKLAGFVNWHVAFQPKYISTERGIFSKKYKYAGTTDCIATIKDECYLIDWKSSRSLQPYFALQTAAYAQALSEEGVKIDRTAVLQLGVNKNGYRFAEYKDWKSDFKVFLGVKKIFDSVEDDEPKIPVAPATLKL